MFKLNSAVPKSKYRPSDVACQRGRALDAMDWPLELLLCSSLRGSLHKWAAKGNERRRFQL